ncbi:MAG: 50S ribosomal protein L6 [bacterium]|nr:50S ribosomal protein L6 [bacterium]
MSRIGKKPILIPSGVVVVIEGKTVRVKGPKGELTRVVHPHVTVREETGNLIVTVDSPDDGDDRALWGLTRRLVANMVDGVTKGYAKKLELVGVGYRAAVSGQKLTLNLGFSHPVDFLLPTGITASVDKNTFLTIIGIDKELLGNVAARIRSFRKPEPYKGKGIKYEGEVIRRKLGKAAKAAGGAGAA